MSSKLASPWTQIIVGGAIINGGLALLAYSIVPTLKDGWYMQQWPSTQAVVTQVELEELSDDESTSWLLSTNYRYQVNGVEYDSQRIDLRSAASSNSDRQHQLASQLEQHKATGNTITAYYNPQNPADSVLFRDIPWDQIAMKSFFVFGFIGMGVLAARSGFRRKRKAQA